MRSKKFKILIVDDEAPIRMLLTQILSSRGYACGSAPDAAAASARMAEGDYDLLLCDINMPGISGLDFVRNLMETHPNTAIIMVTAVVDAFLAESLLKIGVYDYITKPIEKTRVLISVANAEHRLELKTANLSYQADLEKRVEDRTRSLNQTLDKLRASLEGIVHAIARIVETRDPYTAGHQKRVAELGRAIALEMGLADTQVEGVYMAGLIHDLGKIAIPSEILSKPTRLSEIEFNLIKTHSRIGYEILNDIEFPWPIAPIVYQHHERIDGSGYPEGISGEDLLLESRILAVADVVEAMASHRPYRAGLGIEAALAEIEIKGVIYDPNVSRACMNLFRHKGYDLDAPRIFLVPFNSCPLASKGSL